VTSRERVLVAHREGTVGELLDTLGEEGTRALDDGRVFVGRRRARDRSERVSAGEAVTIRASREPAAGARVLAERDGIVAAYKPATMATIPDQRGARGSLLAFAEDATGARLHATSRLDVGVSGVVVFAATDDARRRLADAREQGRYLRHYVAIACRAPDPPKGLWDAPIGRASDPRKRVARGRDAASAETAYAVVALAPSGGALLAVEPKTGRTHQIRVHASDAGAPLLGDVTYGGPARLTSPTGAVTALGRIALHAAWVEVPDRRGALVRIDAEVPGDLRAIWRATGGDDAAWPSALERC
jgi:23S rRNA pseudouridine1911/1915/1917 synthase